MRRGKEEIGERRRKRERVHAGVFGGKIEITREIKRGNRRERKEDATEERRIKKLKEKEEIAEE